MGLVDIIAFVHLAKHLRQYVFALDTLMPSASAITGNVCLSVRISNTVSSRLLSWSYISWAVSCNHRCFLGSNPLRKIASFSVNSWRWSIASARISECSFESVCQLASILRTGKLQAKRCWQKEIKKFKRQYPCNQKTSLVVGFLVTYLSPFIHNGLVVHRLFDDGSFIGCKWLQIR